MTSRDVIRELRNSNNLLKIGDSLLTPDNRRALTWVQYKLRFNERVHYEVALKSNDEVDVRLDDERTMVGEDDELRQKLRERATELKFQVSGDRHLFIRYMNPVKCNERRFEDIKDDIEHLMKKLYDAFEEILYASESVTQIHPGVEKKDLIVRSELNFAESLRPIPCNVVYPVGVKQPSEIEGAVSWVTSIDDLFNRKEIVLSDGRMMQPGDYLIPPYQRKYTWSYANVSQLCRDLLRSYEEGKRTYHLGTVILHRQSSAFFVVDGQQRLTTISYLIGREIFKKELSLWKDKITDSDIRQISAALEEYKDNKECILEQLKRSTLVVIAVSDINEAFQLFSTQNGRGRPLTPGNLLKAYHLHELLKDSDGEKDAKSFDRIWEENSAEKIQDGQLLSQVMGEHLYRLRCWSRGEFPKEQFSNAKIDEFKGITLIERNDKGVPVQNMMKLRQQACRTDDYYYRSSEDKMDPLVMIDQPVVNGVDFFKYMDSYAEAYRILFGSKENKDLKEFKSFYNEYCLYDHSGRRGDTYARHIFESLCLYCYDRFGSKGLDACMRYLYRCAYYERSVKLRCYYSTCGAMFAIQAVRAMTACMTLVDVKDRLHALNGDVLDLYRKNNEFAGKRIPDGIETVRSVYEN